MAVSNKKKAKAECYPGKRTPKDFENPNNYYSCKPTWNFHSCDMEKWSIYSDDVKKLFFSEILPKLQAYETQTWSEILLSSKKQNHSIEADSLNKIAIDRLNELYLELDSVISLTITATHRIYGFMVYEIFNVLWIDLNHGDNSTCVCRSHKKHTH